MFQQITLGAPNTKVHAIGGSAADGTIETLQTATTLPSTATTTTTNYHSHLRTSNGIINGGGGATVTGASSLAHEFGIKKSNSRTPLFRRHSTFQSRPG
uniref:Uncharacterized protein n=1 Tax=Panagrolaimus sp. PS1159 TaxID=55785 RepID=A0AC35FDM2_9BILA